MNKRSVIAVVIVCVLAGIAAFHVIHHELYCKYRATPGKSHCRDCWHRPICRNIHHKLPRE